jgi:hypothetical protein
MGTVCEGGCDLTRRRGDAEENAEKIRGKKSLEEAEKRAGEG